MVWRKTKNTALNESGKFKSMWTSKKKAKALQMYVEEKLSLRKIANHFSCSHGAVQKLMEDEGVIRKKTDKRCNPHTGEWHDVFPLAKYEARILKLYQKPMSSSEVAARIGNGCLACHVEKAANRNGIIRSTSDAMRVAASKGTHPSQIFNQKKIWEHLSLDVKSLDYDDYNYYARRLTYSILTKYSRILNTKKRSKLGYHFDHSFSIYDGFYKLSDDRKFVKRDKPMPLRYLCHPANLNMVSAEYNAYKGGTSDITFAELKKRIKEFESVHGKVF